MLVYGFDSWFEVMIHLLGGGVFILLAAAGTVFVAVTLIKILWKPVLITSSIVFLCYMSYLILIAT